MGNITVNKLNENFKNIKEHFEKANEFLSQGSFKEIISLHKQTLKCSLTTIEKAKTYYHLAIANQFLENKSDYIKHLKMAFQAIENDKDSIESLDLKGQIKYCLLIESLNTNISKKIAKEAIYFFKNLIKMYNVDEDEYGAISYIADIYYQIGKYKKSLKYYENALKLCKDKSNLVWILCGIGSSYGKLKSSGIASDYFRRALSLNDKLEAFSKIYFDFGTMLFECELFIDAKSAFENALKCMVDDHRLKNKKSYEVEIYWYLGAISYELTNFEEMQIYLDKVLENIDINHAHYASCYLFFGHYHLTKKQYEEASYNYNKVLLAPNASPAEKKIATKCLKSI